MTDREYLELERKCYERRKRTRNERKLNRWRTAYFVSVILWALVVIWLLFVGIETAAQEPEKIVEYVYIEVEKEIEPVEDVGYASLEAMFYDKASKIEDCKITHYCSEVYPHICGTGDGLTATGATVTPYWTCAVDPSVIPYGAEVMVDYGDRVEFWKAEDCGGSVKGGHIDLAVTTHEEACDLGVKYADVYWMEDTSEFS